MGPDKEKRSKAWKKLGEEHDKIHGNGRGKLPIYEDAPPPTAPMLPIIYKYINMKQINGEIFNGRPVYRVYNNKSSDQLGVISYYKPWKEYVFSSREECVFNNTCLRDVIKFIENEIPSQYKVK
jgi:hypothetical protein